MNKITADQRKFLNDLKLAYIRTEKYIKAFNSGKLNPKLLREMLKLKQDQLTLMIVEAIVFLQSTEILMCGNCEQGDIEQLLKVHDRFRIENEMRETVMGWAECPLIRGSMLNLILELEDLFGSAFQAEEEAHIPLVACLRVSENAYKEKVKELQQEWQNLNN